MFKGFHGFFSIGLAVAAGCQFSGCGQTAWPENEPAILIDPEVAGLEFWPPTRGYLRRGDSALLLIRGLQRVFTCTRLLQLQADFDSLTPAAQSLGIHATIELPPHAACALDRDGLDTAIRVAISQTGGSRLFLKNRTVDTSRADTVVEGNSRLDSLDFSPDSTRTARLGAFLFLDSSLARPKRQLVSDSLPKCEIFEGAVFVRLGPVYRVRFRRLELDSLVHPALPPCAGFHGDSIETVADQFGFAQRP